MKQNTFLTGPRQIGKSTALCRFLAHYPGRVSGFLTRWNPDGETLHMMHAAVPEGFSADNVIARRRDGWLQPEPTAFDRIGCRLLRAPADLIVMDELGFLERESAAFCARIWELLNGTTPVVGVIRQSGSIFMEQLAQQHNTAIWYVDGANREQIPTLLAQIYR